MSVLTGSGAVARLLRIGCRPGWMALECLVPVGAVRGVRAQAHAGLLRLRQGLKLAQHA